MEAEIKIIALAIGIIFYTNLLIYIYKRSLRSLIVKNVSDSKEIYPVQNRIVFIPKSVKKNKSQLIVGWENNIHETGKFYIKNNSEEWKPLKKNEFTMELKEEKVRVDIKFMSDKGEKKFSEFFIVKNLFNGFERFWQIIRWDNEERVNKKKYEFIDIGEKQKIIKTLKSLSKEIEDLDEFNKAIELMNIVNKLFKENNKPANYNYLTDNTSDILVKVKNGEGGQCGSHAFLYAGLAKAFGLVVRPIGCYWYSHFIPGIVPFQHVISEVWLDSCKKWVVMDSNANAYFKKDGKLLSALDIHNLYINGKTEQIEIYKNGERSNVVVDNEEDREHINDKNWATYFSYYKHLLFFKENLSPRLKEVLFISKILKKLNNPSLFRKIPVLNKIFPRYYHWFDENTPKIRRTKYLSWYLVDIIIIVNVIIFTAIIIYI